MEPPLLKFMEPYQGWKVHGTVLFEVLDKFNEV